MYYLIRPMIAVLLLATLMACGARPPGAASSEPTAAAAPPTAMPAQESAMPSSDDGISQQPTASLPPLDRTSRPAPSVERVPTADRADAVTDEVPQDLLDKIIADAAQRSGVAKDQIIVQVGQAIEWPDSSLGCAQPGVMYMQVITPGYKVVLDAGGVAYDYHADEHGLFVLCQ
ncbi:MAG: hypothetical protein HGA45_22170 [Chloroflexales bacterium]|nr:hypothetical protein [Chloroflexales bacterium]